MKDKILEGRVWMLTDTSNHLIDDIDTDNIFHNQYLHITEIDEMGQYAMGNLEGWKDFPQKVNKGDMIVSGENFGAGSSRQQAVDCFIALGIQAIIAKSFGAIYKRNAINSGLPVFEGTISASSEDIITVDVNSGKIMHDGTLIGKVKPLSEVQNAIYEAGGLFSYARQLKQ
jgi:3-isopropylmalate/(R)-2-methylmalate dehydratase small subunit